MSKTKFCSKLIVHLFAFRIKLMQVVKLGKPLVKVDFYKRSYFIFKFLEELCHSKKLKIKKCLNFNYELILKKYFIPAFF